MEEDEEEEVVVEVVEDEQVVENAETDKVEESVSESVDVVEAKVEIDDPKPTDALDETTVATEEENQETKPSEDLEGGKIEITISET